MRKALGLLLMAGVVLAGGSQSRSQAAAVPQVSAQVAGAYAAGSVVAAANTRSEKQKILATEADRLLDLATELKAQVDLTNKNILSLKVVQKAEELEMYARRIKDEAKKHP